jgi:tetratricopeptide (TPR) repeat protein
VAQVRNLDVPRDSIARLLRVGTLVEGTVEPEGATHVRITVRLYDMSGANLGSPKSIRVARTALFSAEESVARDVAGALREVLGPEIEVREKQSATRNMTAWTLLNRAERARKEAASLGAARPDSALALLQAADSLLRGARAADDAWIDPTLQRVQVALDRLRYVKEAERGGVLDTARVRVEEAFAVDANSAKALELRGTVKYEQWRAGRRTLDAAARDALMTEAESDLLAAIRKDDRLVTAYATLSFLYYDKKDVPAALLKAQTAYQADEFLVNSPAILSRLFYGSYDTQLFADAQRWCDEGGRRFPQNPTFTMCRLWLQLAPDATPDPSGAWALATRMDSLSPPATRAYQGSIARMIVGGVIGRHALSLDAGAQRTAMLDSARRVLERAQADRTVDPGQELPGYRAVMLAQIGDLDQAIALLTSYVAANPDHSFRVGGNVHWWWRDLRSKAGFQTLLSRTR